MEDCYSAGLARHPNLRGRITLRFVIERDGTVSDVTVADNAVADCQVVRCVRTLFGRIHFPAPEGGIVTVQYPIMFEPASETTATTAPAP